ncbi:MAG: AraC family transcriptional regulator [Victivallis sp.]
MVGKLAGLILEVLGSLRRSSGPQGTLFERCVNYVRTHYDDPDLCIGTLCEVFDVPRSTLTKLFSENMQRSLGNYIRDVRYGNALALLRSSDLPFSEVARRCGYASYTSFCRLIHRATGGSPSEVRRTKSGGSRPLEPELKKS